MVFVFDIYKLKASTLFEAKIVIKNEYKGKECYVKPYHYNDKDREEIKRHIDQLMRADIIGDSCSEHNAPCILVRRGDKSRLVCDYRKLNERTRRDAYPMPLLADIMSLMHGAKYFTALDLFKCFHQLVLEEGSRGYTSFSVPRLGKFEYKRVPFGLSQGPSWAQRLIDKVTEGLEFVITYIDDLVVFSKNFHDHLKHVDAVLNRLDLANLSINPNKCSFFQQTISILGYTISENGIEISKEKMHAIADYPVPKKVKEVRQFLGVMQFHSKYIKNFTEKARPLQKLTCKNAKFNWGENEQISFEALKEAMLTPPILKFPDFSLPFDIITDASDIAIAAVLQQHQNAQPCIIDCIGRVLNKAEMNYTITERELLSIIYALTKWERYLKTSQQTCTIYTDHLPLTHLDKISNSQGRLKRWLLSVEYVDFKIKYVAGKINRLADSLSRRTYIRQILEGLPKEFNNTKVREGIYSNYIELSNDEDTPELKEFVDLSGEKLLTTKLRSKLATKTLNNASKESIPKKLLIAAITRKQSELSREQVASELTSDWRDEGASLEPVPELVPKSVVSSSDDNYASSTTQTEHPRTDSPSVALTTPSDTNKVNIAPVELNHTINDILDKKNIEEILSDKNLEIKDTLASIEYNKEINEKHVILAREQDLEPQILQMKKSRN